MELKENLRSYMKIAFVVTNYWVISITMIFANKYLLGNAQSETDMSLFTAWFQCFTVCVIVAISFSFSLLSSKRGDRILLKRHMKHLKNRDVIILGCCFVGMLTFNNLCLRFVGIAFFQIARSLTLLFTNLFSAVILDKPPSRRVVMCCLAVAFGFCLGIDAEHSKGTLSFRGVVFGVITSVFVALTGIYTKKALNSTINNPAQVTIYMNIFGVVLLFPLSILHALFTVNWFTALFSLPFSFWTVMSIAGILSFFIGWASNAQIKYTSPITHHISNNCKSVFQTLLAVLMFDQSKSGMWWLSLVLVIGGAFAYAVIKIIEEQSTKSKRQDYDKSKIEKLKQAEA